MIGGTIAHYRVVAKLGAGGMGEVYRATDSRLGRDVALKLLPPETARDDAARKKLVEEARHASALNHPHICHIYEVNEAGGVTYFAMELAEGEPLSRRIPEDGLPLETVSRYAQQIADALAHAHERGILHRDLKSGNVMVTHSGGVKVLDFGLALRLRDVELAEATRSKITVQQAGSIAGTLAYKAPELLSGQPASERSDIWSLGVLLHEMAAGRLPFEGKTGYELTSAILREPPQRLERVPPTLRAIIQRCLAKEPAQRYQKAAEVRASLEVISSSAGLSGSVQVAAPPASRARWVWAAVTVAAVALALFVAQPWNRRAETGGSPATSETAPARGVGKAFLISRPSANQEANELLQRAMMFTRFQLDPLRARQMLEEALQLDPSFSEARTNYALTYIVAVETGVSNDPADIYRAEEELRRVLQEVPNMARAHALMSAVHFIQGREDLAEQSAEWNRQADSTDLGGRVWMMIRHRLRGDHDEAMRFAHLLLESEPLFWPPRYHLGELLREQGRIPDAMRELEKVLEQDPQNVHGLRCLARAYLDAGNLPQARATLERMRPQDRANFRVRLARAQLLAMEGKRDQALREMDGEVLKYADLGPLVALDAAEVYAVVGEPDKAIEWLDRSMRKGDGRVDWLRRDPLLASVRDHPRFQQILKSMEFRRQQRSTPAKTQ